MGIITSGQGTDNIASKIAVNCERRPTIDLGACNKCGGCIEVAPEIFHLNDVADYFEVLDLDYYDQELVDEAIKNCPQDCISWEHD